MYYTYILECSDNTLYTWITTDLQRRVDEHNSSSLWAKYTSARRPVKLVYSVESWDRSQASKLENQIKQMTKKQKKELIERANQND